MLASAPTTVSWKAALTLVKGVHLRKLQPEMLTDKTVVTVHGNNNQVYNIVYDKEYVYKIVLDKVLIPLGIVSPTGKIKKDFLMNTFIPDLIDYIESQPSRIKPNVYNLAKQLSSINGLSIDENVKIILNTQNNDDENEYDDDNE